MDTYSHSLCLEEKTEQEGKGKGNAIALTKISSTELLSLGDHTLPDTPAAQQNQVLT